jgi:hypothetical protein
MTRSTTQATTVLDLPQALDRRGSICGIAISGKAAAPAD